jgi:hypothetical protein
MTLRWRRNPRLLAIQPPFHLRPRRDRALRTLEDSRVRYDAQERQEARPRKPDAPCSVEAAIEPVTRRVVLRKLRDARVYEKVGVDENQR